MNLTQIFQYAETGLFLASIGVFVSVMVMPVFSSIESGPLQNVSITKQSTPHGSASQKMKASQFPISDLNELNRPSTKNRVAEDSPPPSTSERAQDVNLIPELLGLLKE